MAKPLSRHEAHPSLTGLPRFPKNAARMVGGRLGVHGIESWETMTRLDFRSWVPRLCHGLR